MICETNMDSGTETDQDLELVWGASTDVGRERSENEDSFSVDAPVFAVADGMGGALGGAFASRRTIEVLDETVAARPEGQELQDTLCEALWRANSDLAARASRDASLEGMGTTCIAVGIEGPKATFAHVGDSRVYLLREGALHRLTKDHTLRNEMRDRGLVEDEADLPPRHILARCIGMGPGLRVDVASFDVQAEDVLMLCSDGLYEHVEDEVIGHVLAERDPHQAATDLTDLANEGGGSDNITIVVVHVQAPNGAARDASSDAGA